MIENPHAPPTPEPSRTFDTAATRREYLTREAVIRGIGALYCFVGGLGLIAGIAVLIFFYIRFNTPLKPNENMRGVELILYLVAGIPTLIFGTFLIWGGYGLCRLRSWGQIFGGILAAFGLVCFPAGTVISTIILLVIFTERGNFVFSQEHRMIREQTPHISYGTEVASWLFLELMLLILGIGTTVVLITLTRGL